MNILIPMAGRGSRFSKTHSLPKPLIDINGKPMISRALETLSVEGNYIFIVRKDEYLEQTYQAIRSYVVNPTFIEIDYVTEGAAQSCLLAKEYIDNDEELLMANCDQIMNWDPNPILSYFKKYDGGIVTVFSDDPKHSYASVYNGLVNQIVEKEVISNLALTGIHYWRHGSDFVRSAEQLISDDNRSNGEFYVAPTYNYLIKDDKKIVMYNISNKRYLPVGTPEDLNKYLNETR